MRLLEYSLQQVKHLCTQSDVIVALDKLVVVAAAALLLEQQAHITAAAAAATDTGAR